jgi:probable HAF family extracellular repeat protein
VIFAACSGGTSITPERSTILRNNVQPLQKVAATKRNVRYEVIDLGTFGGPLSSFGNPGEISKNGAAAGYSATDASTGPTSHFLICGGLDNIVPFITLAFEWNNGTLTKLSALSPSGSCSEPLAVNASGEVAGIAENGEVDPLDPSINQAHAVRWVNGRVEDLGSLGGYQNGAGAMNDGGQIVGESTNTIPDPFSPLGFLEPTQTRAFLWQNGHMQDIGTLGGGDAQAFAINDSGQILGTSYTNAIPNSSTGVPTWDPFVWQNGKMRDLGSLGGVFSVVGQINARGQVLGASSIAADPGACALPEHSPGLADCHPFLWDRGKMVDLFTGTVGGQPFRAARLDDAGEIVGQAFFSNDRPADAVLIKKGVATDLGNLGDCFSTAHDINARDQIVGITAACDPVFIDFHRPFIWQHGTIADLNDLIPANSPVHIVSPDAISNNGVIIADAVPQGVSPQDFLTQGHAVVLIPIGDQNAPLPATAAPPRRHIPTPSEVAVLHTHITPIDNAFLWRHHRR